MLNLNIMKRIHQLIGILDPKLVDQLIYLDRVVKLYSRFLNSWKPAEIKSNGKILIIKFYSRTRYGYDYVTEGEFDIADIQKHIKLYKEKLKEEFANRHTNIRIHREKNTVSWKNYIKDAEVQM